MVSGWNLLTCAFLISGHILGLSARLSPSLTSSHSHIYISLGSYTPCSACPSHISSFSHVTTTGTIRPAQFQISHQWRLSTRLSLTITYFPHHILSILILINQATYTFLIHISITSHFHTQSQFNISPSTCLFYIIPQQHSIVT